MSDITSRLKEILKRYLDRYIDKMPDVILNTPFYLIAFSKYEERILQRLQRKNLVHK